MARSEKPGFGKRVRDQIAGAGRCPLWPADTPLTHHTQIMERILAAHKSLSFQYFRFWTPPNRPYIMEDHRALRLFGK